MIAYSTPMDYVELCLEVRETESGRFIGRVSSSPAGQSGEFPIKLMVDPSEIADVIASVGWQAQGTVTRSYGKSSYDQVESLGQSMFGALLESDFGRIYRTAQTIVQGQNTGIRLRLASDSAAFLDLPWELLRDVNVGDYTALATRTPIVRQWLPGARIQLSPLSAPLRLLILVSEVVAMDSSQEIAAIQELASSSGKFNVEVRTEVRRSQFLEILKQPKAEIIHFIGTGAYGNSPRRWTVESRPASGLQQGLLLLDDEPGPGKDSIAKAQWVSASEIARSLSASPGVRLMMINGCKSEAVARDLTLASPSVIGMRGDITSVAAIAFVTGLYQELSRSQPLEAAVTEGRRNIDRYHPGTREWSMPVFYMQTPDGKLIDPNTTSQTMAISKEAAPSSKGDGSKAHTTAESRELSKSRKLLELEEQNLTALQAQSTPNQEAPDYIRNQIDESLKKIEELKAQIDKLSR